VPANNRYNLVAENQHLPAPQSEAARQAGSTVVAFHHRHSRDC